MLRLAAAFGVLLFAVPSFGQAPETIRQGAGWIYTRTGHATDAKRKTQAGILFGGGGTDVDGAFRWMCGKAGGGDFLVIRATGTAAYNPYISALCPGLNSVATLRIESRAAAMDPFVKETILNAEALFISGGDQANYANFWQGTPVQDAINQLAANHVPVGGTSAGNAMLAHYAFPALHDTVTSAQALADPFAPSITIDIGFLNLSPLLWNVITDDHFVTRDRMGRLVAFLARMTFHKGVRQVSGIAVSDRTAFLMEPDGSGLITGSGSVYFLRTTFPPQTLLVGTPLTFRHVQVSRAPAGSHFNIRSWTGDQAVIYSISAVNGSLQSSQKGGSIY